MQLYSGISIIAFINCRSDCWRTVSIAEISKKVDDDGEFFMSFDDMVKYFTDLEMCHISMDVLYQDDEGTATIRLEWFHPSDNGGTT